MEVVKTAPCGEGAVIAQIAGNSAQRFKTELERAQFALSINNRRYNEMFRLDYPPKTMLMLIDEARKEHQRWMFNEYFAYFT